MADVIPLKVVDGADPGENKLAEYADGDVVPIGHLPTAANLERMKMYGGWWRKARVRYLNEYPLCVSCETHGHVAVATVVDHIVPHQGDATDWQPLCAGRHNRKTMIVD